MSTDQTITGNLTAAPEIAFSQGSGNAWGKFTIASERGKDDKKTTTFQRCKVFGSLAENLASSCDKGTRVIATGYLVTESWEKGGQKRSENVLIVNAIGPELRWAEVAVNKNTKAGGQFAKVPPAGGSATDPWASAPEPTEPPF